MILEILYMGEVVTTVDLQQVTDINELECSVRLKSKADDIYVSDKDLNEVIIPRCITPDIYHRWKAQDPPAERVYRSHYVNRKKEKI